MENFKSKEMNAIFARFVGNLLIKNALKIDYTKDLYIRIRINL